MFLYLLLYRYANNSFDFYDRTYPSNIVLYLEPLDHFEFYMKEKIWTVISDVNGQDGFFLEIKSSKDGDTIEHGTFDEESHLMAVSFKERNYSLSFSNEGINQIKFSLVFTKDILNVSHIINNDIKIGDFVFPIIDYELTNSTLNNFLFEDKATTNYIYLYIAFGVQLGMSFFIMLFCSKLCCSCCHPRYLSQNEKQD